MSLMSRLIRPPTILLDQIDGGLAELVHRGHHFGIGLIGALKNDEIGELPGNIDVGGFDGAGRH